MRPMIEAAARNKLNDLAVHENISQSTMRISPPRASAIRQAVAAMRVFFLPVRVICLVKNAAEPRVSRRLSLGANPISLGRVRGRGRARVRAPANWFGRRRASTAPCLKRQRDYRPGRPPSDLGKWKRKRNVTGVQTCAL